MATRNAAGSTNDVNMLLYSYGSVFAVFTDRTAGSFAARDELYNITNFPNHDTSDAFTTGSS